MAVVDTTLTAKVMAKEVKLSNIDYKARFDKGRWIVRWKWKNDQAPPNSDCHNYVVSKGDVGEFNEEV